MTQTTTNKLNRKSEQPVKNGAGGSDIDSNLNEIKEDLARLKGDFSSLFDSVGKAAKLKTEEGTAKGGDLAEQVGNNAKETQAYVEDQIKARPLAAVGLALGAGFLFAKLRK
jgi:ElaB/YqjD/DUF883 family membrane-anchored ribosome-binding protein